MHEVCVVYEVSRQKFFCPSSPNDAYYILLWLSIAPRLAKIFLLDSHKRAILSAGSFRQIWRERGGGERARAKEASNNCIITSSVSIIRMLPNPFFPPLEVRGQS
jgi:hypothetical protein